MFDVLCIGGGPQSLAVVARLASHVSPNRAADDDGAVAAELTHNGVDAHSHFAAVLEKRARKQKQREKQRDRDCGEPLLSVAVVDASSPNGDWLSRWRSQLQSVNVEYLRSLITDHPDPSDRLALLAHCNDHASSRIAESVEKHILQQTATSGARKKQKRRRAPRTLR
eukprot:TRINITY_DN7953_c0_g1_i1.p1 TRINITY_DN7953_c0_g1~~TRINITY_DN7953_c0_g1_i1.p1  ORF type:complete len:194 (+),score=70.06 TRINITY_DN7953_c0_g1_i1:79-582(+)